MTLSARPKTYERNKSSKEAKTHNHIGLRFNPNTESYVTKGHHYVEKAAFEAQSAPPLLEVFSNTIPSNPISAMTNGDILSIILLPILIGISISIVGKPVKGLVQRLKLT